MLDPYRDAPYFQDRYHEDRRDRRHVQSLRELQHKLSFWRGLCLLVIGWFVVFLAVVLAHGWS